MPRQRILGGVATTSLLLWWLAVPAAAADGLSRFEAALKDAPPGALTYKSGKALGDNGFVLDGVVVTAPAEATGGTKAEPIQIKRIVVEDFDFASIDKNVPPNFVKIRVEGIAIGPNPAEGIDLKALTGLDELTADFQLDYRVDGERKTMTLNRLELDLNGLARLELSMVLDGIEADAIDSSSPNATLRTASLVFEDRTLLGKTLPAAAKMQGSDADGLVKMAKAMLGEMREGQGPATLAVLDALASYVDDYKQPKGVLRLTFNPTGKTSVGSLSAMKSADDAVKALGLVVSYAGTRAQATPAGDVPDAAAATKGGAKK
jgi:hypothetical protein